MFSGLPLIRTRAELPHLAGSYHQQVGSSRILCRYLPQINTSQNIMPSTTLRQLRPNSEIYHALQTDVAIDTIRTFRHRVLVFVAVAAMCAMSFFMGHTFHGVSAQQRLGSYLYLVHNDHH
jgi:hypothetical protein